MLPEPINATVCLLALVSALVCIVAETTMRRRIARIFKPLTMVLVLAVALQPSLSTPPAYRVLVVSGLVFSLAGDVLLMLPSERFEAGLASFLIAHLLYVVAFAGAADPAPLALLACVAAAGLVYAAVLPKLGALRVPALVYAAAVAGTVWLATGRWLAVGQLGSLLACIGAALLAVSGAVLAIDRFARAVPGARAVVLGTYFPAQMLIALSIGVGEALVDWAMR